MIGVAMVEKFAFYRIIIVHLRGKIDEFGVQLFNNVTDWVSAIALVLVTLWILIHGYRIATGTSRESSAAFVASAAKMAFICTLATTMSFMGTSVNEFIGERLPNEITKLVTSEDKTAEQQIDESMGWMSVALTAIDAVDTGGDESLDSRKTQAMVLAGVGTGGPAVVAGSMLMLYQIALVLFVGLGPLFILSLMFDQTKSFFSKWLFYGVGTMFSMAVLAVMTSISMQMVASVAKAMWASSIIGAVTGLGGGYSEGVSAMAMQQGGVGLMLTTLILTAPPIAALFFQGTLANFTPYSAIGSVSRSADSTHSPGRNGEPPGHYQSQSGGPRHPQGDYREENISSSVNQMLGARVAGAAASQPAVSDGRRGKASSGDF